MATEREIYDHFARELKILTERFDNQMVPSDRKARIIKHLAKACIGMMKAETEARVGTDVLVNCPDCKKQFTVTTKGMNEVPVICPGCGWGN